MFPYFRTVISIALMFVATMTLLKMWEANRAYIFVPLLLAASSQTAVAQASCGTSAEVDLGWYPSNATEINSLTSVLNETGVYGFIFNATTPDDVPYDTYNWCNMPHVRKTEYQVAPSEYKLEYVEVIHRHHKRTPYASNTFPRENYAWYCDDEALSFYGFPIPDSTAAQVAWSVYTTDVNPFAPAGFNGTCQFPQITAQGLEDSRQHGKDLYAVYHDQLNFLPSEFDTSTVQFRVTNNVITSQVAGQVILGMFPATENISVSVRIQPDSIDSLEPSYSCPSSDTTRELYGVGSNFSNWTDHLTAPQTVSLFERLEAISNVNASDSAEDWYSWFDHYFDNLSARLCHQKPLPCTADNETCVSEEDADAVFRRGQYEYSFIYRDSPSSLASSASSYGVWLAELAANLREASGSEESGVLYRHNIAHDGSMSRLLSILQVDQMVWPGMGSELVFELYSRDECYFLRVLWKGQVMRSSNPSLGLLDMLSLDTFLGYVDGLVGPNASMVPGLCEEIDEE
jgi:2-phosphoxylose phosphatase